MDREYHFVSKELFRQMIERKEFLEWTQFSGHFYGTSWAALQDVQRSGRIAVLDLEIKGVAKVKEAGLLTKCVLIRTRELEQLVRDNYWSNYYYYSNGRRRIFARAEPKARNRWTEDSRAPKRTSRKWTDWPRAGTRSSTRPSLMKTWRRRSQS